MAKKLTPKQKAFADEYLIDLNATQAAIRAGYSEKTAKEIGCENLTKPNIAEYIAERQAEREKRTEITQDKVLREIAIIAFAKATDFAKVVEKRATLTVEGEQIPLYDADGNPLMYRDIELVLTEELTEEQQKAIAVIKRGRDGLEVRPYDKLKALDMLGRHLGMWDKKEEDAAEKADDGFIDALRSEAAEIWEE